MPYKDPTSVAARACQKRVRQRAKKKYGSARKKEYNARYMKSAAYRKRTHSERTRRLVRNTHYLHTYGISRDEFEAKIAAQGGLCPIGMHPLGALGKLAGNSPCMDHNHKTGKNRAVLCRTHNMGLGAFGDSAAELQIAISYLNRYGENSDGSD